MRIFYPRLWQQVHYIILCSNVDIWPFLNSSFPPTCLHTFFLQGQSTQSITLQGMGVGGSAQKWLFLLKISSFSALVVCTRPICKFLHNLEINENKWSHPTFSNQHQNSVMSPWKRGLVYYYTTHSRKWSGLANQYLNDVSSRAISDDFKYLFSAKK